MTDNIDWDNIFIIGGLFMSMVPPVYSRKPKDLVSLISDEDLKIDTERHAEFMDTINRGEGFGWEIQ